jgi:hypothetical protein
MGSPVVPSPKVQTKALFCPNCGGPIQLRGFAHTLTAVCQHCLSVLDATTPTLHILQTIQEKMRRTPKVPLGSRGKFDGITYEAIGFQTRATDVEGVTYEWDEYVLFNPFAGFLYLSEYSGHWNVIRPVYAIPEVRPTGHAILDRSYRHFQHSAAETIFVLGEFPWRVRAGEDVVVDDYTSPPYVLSAERTGNEVTWSLGVYTPGQDIWKTFGLKDKPPPAIGPYLNQPNPHGGKAGEGWRLFGFFMLALVALAAIFSMTSQRKQVLDETHHLYPDQKGEQSFVTPVFDLTGHESNVEVKTKTDLSDSWIYINYALINSDSGHAFNFGREISYYTSGGETEGARTDTVSIPSVPAGHYYLHVDPEGDPKGRPVEYDIIVRRDVPSVLYFLLAAILLTIPPIIIGWRSYHFEYLRWQESDYSKGSGGGD